MRTPRDLMNITDTHVQTNDCGIPKRLILFYIFFVLIIFGSMKMFVFLTFFTSTAFRFIRVCSKIFNAIFFSIPIKEHTWPQSNYFLFLKHVIGFLFHVLIHIFFFFFGLRPHVNLTIRLSATEMNRESDFQLWIITNRPERESRVAHK